MHFKKQQEFSTNIKSENVVTFRSGSDRSTHFTPTATVQLRPLIKSIKEAQYQHNIYVFKGIVCWK